MVKICFVRWSSSSRRRRSTRRCQPENELAMAMSINRGLFIKLLAGVLSIAAQPAQAQRVLGLGPAEGVAELAKQVGKRFSFVCPATDGKNASVYGTDVYTADSAVCAAAIHASVLKPMESGAVTLVIGSGAESFQSTTRNGVTTRSYGRWNTSYTFARDQAPGSVSWRTTWTQVPADFTAPITLECPAGGTLNGGALWGTNVYTKDSTICVAAVHSGLLTAERGGVVVLQRVPGGLKEYEGSEHNGIASQKYGPYTDAFRVSAARSPAVAREVRRESPAVRGTTTPVVPTGAPVTVASQALDAAASSAPIVETPAAQNVAPVEGQFANHAEVGQKFSSPNAMVPSGFAARVLGAGGGGGAVALTWQPVPGALAYRVEGPGVAPEGIVVPAGAAITLNGVPAGAHSWRLAAVYENDYWDRDKVATTSAVVRFLPTRTTPWLSKYGAGGPGKAIEHYLTLCAGCFPGISWDLFVQHLGGLGKRLGIECEDYFGLESASYADCGEPSYLNTTDFGSMRSTSCFALLLGGTLCYSKGADHGRTAIVRRQNTSWFLAFNAPGDSGPWTLTDRVTVDSEGAKFVPNTCLACHGGNYNSTTGIVVDSTLLPLDPSLLQIAWVTTFENGTYHPNAHPPTWVEKELIRPLNKVIVENGSPAVGRYLRGIYGSTLTNSPNMDAVPQGWASQAGLYRQVVKPYCAMCHLAATSSVDLSSFENFTRDKQRIFAAVCTTRSMPHSEIAFKNFWTKDTGALFVPGMLAATLGFPGCP
jgi:hypothetical protein